MTKLRTTERSLSILKTQQSELYDDTAERTSDKPETERSLLRWERRHMWYHLHDETSLTLFEKDLTKDWFDSLETDNG